VAFDLCIAATGGGFLYPGTGELITMVNEENYEISVPSAVGNDIRIDYTGGPPHI
jgi:hypothetical protein